MAKFFLTSESGHFENYTHFCQDISYTITLKIVIAQDNARFNIENIYSNSWRLF